MNTSYRLPTIRLQPGHDDDLIAWCTEVEKLPHGLKGKLYKDTLRRGLGITSGTEGSTPRTPERTPELDTQALLIEMRRVVEAAVESALGRSGQIVARPNDVESDTGEPDRDFLKRAAFGMLLGDEEEEEDE